MNRLQKSILIFTVLLTLYALLGFFALPPLLKSQLLKAVAAHTGRPAALGKVSCNPFALSATLRDFVLPDRNGERLLAFDQFYINFEVSSLWYGGYVFSEINLRAPYLRFLQRADGSSNLQEVMPPDTATSAAPQSKTEPVPKVFIDNLVIGQGEIVYEDHQRHTPFVGRLDSLDLALRNFTTRPDEEGAYQFEATTDRGEGLKWRGNISVIPFRSAGHLALTGFKAHTFWEYLQDTFNFELTSGLVDFQADYVIDAAAEPLVFNLSNGSGAVQALHIVDRRDSSEAVTLPSLQLAGLQADVTKSTLRIGEIQSTGGHLFASYQPDSTLTLSTLFLPKLDPAVPDTAAPWQVTLDRLALEKYSFHMQDRTTTPFAQLEFNPLRVEMANYVYGLTGQPAQLNVEARLREGGRLAAHGTYLPEPMSTSLQVRIDSLALLPFQPYVNSMGKLELKSGTLSLTGVQQYQLRGEQMLMDFRGEVRLENMRAVDLILNEDFLRWGRLELKRLHYSDDPPGLSIAEIVARRPYIRMIIGPDRVTNVQHILGTVPDSLALADSTQLANAPPPTDSTAVTPTKIGQVRFVDGAMNFSDLSLTPNFNVGILEMNGAITGLSSEQLDSAVVDLNGKVDKYAPVTISGLINPLTANAFTDILMKFQSIELTTFTPYSGKFLGYKIDKGKLHLDLHYVLSGRTLDSQNHIVLDQLTLGEKVDSPDATSLPLKLAIALLKDSHGVINLDIPVKGSLDDPKFSIMPIVWKILVNLLVKAVTSPFKLLGALFGGGHDEDLEYVSFSPGADSLAASQRAKLDSLAKALSARPGLKLDIRGAAAPSVDREVLASQTVTAQIRPNGSTPFDPASLNKPERERLIKLYQDTFSENAYTLVAEKDAAGKKIPREQREAAVCDSAFQQLVSNFSVSESAFRTLAQNRAAAIKDRLVLQGAVEELRVFLQDVEIDASAEQGEVRMRLALDAR